MVSLLFTNEWVDGKNTGGKIFRVGVIKKLPKTKIEEPNIFIPKFFQHNLDSSNEMVAIPVTVVEEGELKFLGNHVEDRNSGDPLLYADDAAYKGGSLIRNVAIKEAGCLGVNTQYQGSYRLLSAAHVLTKFDRSNIGKEISLKIEQKKFVPIGATITDQVNVVVYDTESEPNPVRAKQDLAWADIPREMMLKYSPEIETIGKPGKIRRVIDGEKVKCYAGCSGDRWEEVKVSSTTAKTRMRMDPFSNPKFVFFEEVCWIDRKRMFPKPYVGEGDSGTAIVAEEDNALLGILIAQTELSYYFCKLEP